jgi:hypothetical protein
MASLPSFSEIGQLVPTISIFIADSGERDTHNFLIEIENRNSLPSKHET